MTYKLPMNEDGSVDIATFVFDLECYEDVADGLDGRQYPIRTIQNREQVLHDFAAHYMALGAKREREALKKICDKRIKVWRARINSLQYEYTYCNALRLKACYGHINEAECLRSVIRARGEVWK